MPNLDRLSEAIQRELRRFVGESTGRSAAVQVLDIATKAPLRVDVAGDAVRPAASLLKLLPAIALYEAAAKGKVDLDQTIPVADLGTTSYPTVLAAFAPDRQLSLREICALSLITSDNPAAEHLRRLIGPRPLEQIVKRLDLKSVSFEASFTDPELGGANRRNTVSALDILRLVVHIATEPRLTELKHLLVNNLRNTRIPLRLDDDIPVMHKTGSLEGVANDAGVVYTPSHQVALGFLCEDEADTARTSIEIGDTTIRIIELLDPITR